MNEEPLINPITIFGPGECIQCGGPLLLADSELCCMLLGKNGMPIKEDTIIRCEGYCNRCDKRYPMMRYGFGYRPYSKTYKLFERLGQNRTDKLSHTDTDENPFVNENGGG